MPRPTTAARNRLLVEGTFDLFAIAHLLDARHPKARAKFCFDTRISPNAPYIEAHGGLSKLLKKGVIEFSARTYERTGIVVDADDNLQGHWDSVRDRLAAADVALPKLPVAGGAIVDGVKLGRKVGVWLMPDNARAGALEELLLPLVPAVDALWPVADASTAQAEQTERRFGTNDGLKARLRCWLAWQTDPGAGVGPALNAGVLDPLHAAADPFVKWLDDLFAS